MDSGSNAKRPGWAKAILALVRTPARAPGGRAGDRQSIAWRTARRPAGACASRGRPQHAGALGDAGRSSEPPPGSGRPAARDADRPVSRCLLAAPGAGRAGRRDAGARHGAVHVVYLGYGELEGALRERAKEPRYGGRLHVLDAVPPDVLPEWVASADVGVMPIQASTLNHRLSSPNKLFESIATGLPVVVSDFTEMRRIVLDDPDGPLGAVCDPVDPASIAAAIRSILDLGPAEREALRAAMPAGRARALELGDGVGAAGRALRLAGGRAAGGRAAGGRCGWLSGGRRGRRLSHLDARSTEPFHPKPGGARGIHIHDGARVVDQGAAHGCRERLPIEPPVVGPLGGHHDRIGAADALPRPSARPRAPGRRCAPVSAARGSWANTSAPAARRLAASARAGDSRTSSVLALNANPSSPIRRPARDPGPPRSVSIRATIWRWCAVVERWIGREQGRLHVERGVCKAIAIACSGRHEPPIPGPGAQERGPDPTVEADPGDHLLDVGAGRVRHPGKLVGERDLHPQEDVGTELDQRHGPGVGDQRWRVERLVQVQHGVRGGDVTRFEPAGHDAVGPIEVVERLALAHEFGVGDDRRAVGRLGCGQSAAMRPGPSSGRVDRMTIV